MTPTVEPLPDDLMCPVCNLSVPSGDFTNHVEHCLINGDPVPVDPDNLDHEDEDVDIVEGRGR